MHARLQRTIAGLLGAHTSRGHCEGMQGSEWILIARYSAILLKVDACLMGGPEPFLKPAAGWMLLWSRLPQCLPHDLICTRPPW